MYRKITVIIACVSTVFVSCDGKYSSEQGVQECLRVAGDVFAGKVIAIHKLDINVYEPGLTHQPDWHWAEIRVFDTSLAGSPSADGVNKFVYFPASVRGPWASAPKLFVGDTGVYVTHMYGIMRRSEENGPVFSGVVLALLDENDFQEIDRLPAIREYLEEYLEEKYN